MACHPLFSLTDLPIEPEVLVRALGRLGGAVLMALLVYLGYRVLRGALCALERRQRISPQIALVGRRILRWTALALGVVVVLQLFGLLGNLWTFLSTVMALVAIGFVAVWSVLSNVLCSVILIISRPFQVGDTVELPAQQLEGKVVNFTLLFTTLRDDNGALIQIPNNTFFQVPIRRKPGATVVSLEEQLDKMDNAE